MGKFTLKESKRSILCPVDLSPPSAVALRTAVMLAQRLGGRVTVMFVNHPMLVAATNAAYKGRLRYVDDTRPELERFVQRVTGIDPKQGSITLVVRVGDPAEEILREARRIHSVVIVMGTHGRRGIQKVLLGSTTEQVLRRARIPVLAIPPAAGSRGIDALLRPIAPSGSPNRQRSALSIRRQ